MKIIQVKGQKKSLSSALYSFDVGELTEDQVYQLFQQVIDLGLISDLPHSYQNAADVFIRCGICRKKK